MSWSIRLQFTAVAMACVGMLVPVPALYGAGPTTQATLAGAAPAAPRPAPLVGDVALDAHGVMHGVVVDPQGVPLSGVDVSLWQANRELVQTKTNTAGRFGISGLRNGAYQVAAGRYVRAFRVWPSRTAPPSAKQMAVVVTTDDVVRGQRRFGEAFDTNVLVVGAMVAAAIALPLTMNRFGSSSASP